MVRRPLLLLLTVALLATTACQPRAVDAPAPLGHALFAPASPFNTPIPPSPVVAPESPALVRQLASGPHPGIANLHEFGPTYYEASPGDRAYTVTVTERWGPSPFAAYNPIRVPDTAAPSVGSDGWLVVVDRARGLMFEIWQARKAGGEWIGSWGSVFRLGGMEHTKLAGSGSGSGLAIMAGVVRQSELDAGVIDHALAFSTDMGHPTSFLFPATKTDAGKRPNDYAAKLPQGARIQLDPSIDVDALPGLTRGERAVARALQRYGAYNVDTGGAHMGFYFEGQDLTDPARRAPVLPGDATRPGGTYERAGFEWDYFGMDRIPWSRLRVLASWNGR